MQPINAAYLSNVNWNKKMGGTCRVADKRRLTLRDFSGPKSAPPDDSLLFQFDDSTLVNFTFFDS